MLPAPTDLAARAAAAGRDLRPRAALSTTTRKPIIVDASGAQVPANMDVGNAGSPRHPFTSRGVQLTSVRIGGIEAENGRKVAPTTGAPISDNPNDLRPETDQQIVVRRP